MQDHEMSKPAPMSTASRMAKFGFAIVHNGLMGGIIFGWASIDRSVLAASKEEGGAALTPAQTTAIFTVASSLAMISSLLLGSVLDCFGPRMCSIVSSALVALGSQVVAQSESYHSIMIGMSILAFGGPGVTSCIIHISNLFPRNEYLMMSILSGSVAMSFSVFAVFDFAWATYDHITYETIFQYYFFVVVLIGVIAAKVYPDTPYEREDPAVCVIDDVEMDEEDIEEELTPLRARHSRISTYAVPKLWHEKLGIDDMDLQEEITPLRARRSRISTYAVPKLWHEKPDADEMDDMGSPRPRCARRSRISIYAEPKLWHEKADMYGVDTTRAQRASLIMTAPLDSYLRDDEKMLLRSDSFLMSEFALEGDEPNLNSQAISLKDHPFKDQLFSWAFGRALLVFIVPAFSTAFTVASLNTELDDRHEFPQDVQHDLVVDFTVAMSLGTFASIISGAYIDRFGVVSATYVTLFIGQAQMLSMLFAGHHPLIMKTSFYMYSLFRQFLYPVFIASLTDRLGFKYFGMLLGVGFTLAGVTQLLQATLVNFAHANQSWEALHVIFIVLYMLLMVCPALDARDEKIKEKRISLFSETHNECLGLAEAAAEATKHFSDSMYGSTHCTRFSTTSRDTDDDDSE